jgi:hypothetical protein
VAWSWRPRVMVCFSSEAMKSWPSSSRVE